MTFIWISAIAAVICEVMLLSLIAVSELSRSWRMLRTSACDATSESRYFFWLGFALPRYSSSSCDSV
ncbi:MAG TPA: hypothetical protein VFD36_06615 [Kofleriaceae bacterium]|nr:hypothetical protein [Kofleriaceae bacterium]